MRGLKMEESIDKIINFLEYLMQSNPFWIIVSVFIGTISTYYVNKRAEVNKGRRRTWVAHINALVSLQHSLNTILNILNTNKIIASNTLRAKAENPNNLILTRTVPHLVPNDSMNFQMLQRNELINAFFSFNIKIEKINNDTKTASKTFTEYRSAKILGQITDKEYIKIHKEYCNGLNMLLKSYDLLEIKTSELLARVRVSLELDNKHKNSSFIKRASLEEVTEFHINNELEELSIEIEEVRRKSKEDIDKYLDNED